MGQIFSIDFRNRQAATAEMTREFEECNVLFPHSIENADGPVPSSSKPDNPAPRAAKLSLERVHLLDGHSEMPLEELFEKVYIHASYDNTERIGSSV